MPRQVFAVALLALVLASPAAAGSVQIMPGVTYDHVRTWTSAGPVSMYVVTAPKPGGLYGLNVLLSNGTIAGRETVSSMERDVSSQMTTIGVNGDFFNWNGGWPSGLLIQGGVVEHQPVFNRAAAGIDTSGTLHVDRVPWFAFWRAPDSNTFPIAQLNEPPRANSAALFTPVWGASTPAVKGVAAVLEPFPTVLPYRDLAGTATAVVSNSAVTIPRDGAVLVARGDAASSLLAEAAVGTQLTIHITLRPDWNSVTDAVSGGPTLVLNGRPIADAHEALTPVQLRGREPRTAIGQRPDGTIVMVAVDGRKPGWSIGISNWDLALTLIRYGCVTGFALDSGGSTTIALDGQVLNRPSDPTGERAVGEAVVIGYTGVFAPVPAATLSPNGDGRADQERLAYKVVRPSTVSAKLIAPDGSSRDIDTGTKNPGRHNFTWNGTDPTGAPAPEGRYQWTVTATDDLGRTSTISRSFMLDDTLGFLRVARNARMISFTLTRDANVRVTIETAAGDILRTAAVGPRSAGRVSVRWNGRDGRRKRLRSGTYVVQVAATSTVGTSELRIPLRIRR
jgi:exopolysaccharide biosynthesis protein/flagellar hook assembly protein FlgD